VGSPRAEYTLLQSSQVYIYRIEVQSAREFVCKEQLRRVTLRTPLHLLLRQFNLGALAEWQLPLRYNIAPTQDIAVLIEVDFGRALEMMRWGLIPSWSKDPKAGHPLFNARSEVVAVKAAFRSAMVHRRCLIPADGFSRWRKKGKKKQPIFLRRPGDQHFAFAGLWVRWHDVCSCMMLTTESSPFLAPLHDRMPVILSPKDYGVRVDVRTEDHEKLKSLFEPCPESELIGDPVTTSPGAMPPIARRLIKRHAECRSNGHIHLVDHKPNFKRPAGKRTDLMHILTLQKQSILIPATTARRGYNQNSAVPHSVGVVEFAVHFKSIALPRSIF
jgi:putative SOS response-associated peptidase YedK